MEGGGIRDGTVGGRGLLVRLEERVELDELAAADDAVEVHLLQDGVGLQLLAALVLEQGGQHAAALLAGRGQDGADQGVAQRRHALVLVDDAAVRQLVVALRRLDELAPVVQHPRVAHLHHHHQTLLVKIQ